MRLEEIKIKDNIVSLKMSDDEKETKYKILLDDYLSLSIKEGDDVPFDMLTTLRHLHLLCYGFNKCMKKLSNGDRTIKEMEIVLKGVSTLNDKDIQSIIDRLASLGYLSDESVIESQLFVDQKKLIGKKKTLSNLIKRGVDKNTAYDEISKVPSQDEYARGIAKATILANKKSNKSYKETIYNIRKKLVEDGFEDVDLIMNGLSIEKDEKKEKELLMKLADKTINIYKKKLSGKKLYQKVFQYLLSKGYQSEDITLVLGNMEGYNED